jgi:hypothetical protein
LRFEISNLKFEITRRRCIKATAGLGQNSPIKGQRYLTDRERKDFQSRKEQAEFIDMLETCIKKDRPGEEI